MYQAIAVRPDGDYVVVNLPSATPSGLFRIDHNTGADTQMNTGTHFGDGPTGVVIGEDGHYYVAALGARAVIGVDKATGAETIVSSGGHFVSPSGIAVSSDGHLLVVDHGFGQGDPAMSIRRPATSTSCHQEIDLQAPIGIAVDGHGNILVADMAADKLLRINPASGVQSVVVQGGLLAGIRSVAVVGS